MKLCGGCEQSLDDTAFSKNKLKSDGLDVHCKACAAKRYRAWKLSNLERDRARVSAWSKQNKEKRRESGHKRRLLEKAKSFSISAKDLKRILSMPCYNCGSRQNITYDHVVPMSRGGNHGIGNMMPLCSSCNSSKGTKLLIEWKHKHFNIVEKELSR